MSLNIDTLVQYIKGVGPKLGSILHEKGILTVRDLLQYYPRTYEDRRAATNIKGLQPNQMVSLIAEVVRVRSIPTGRNRSEGRGRREFHEVILQDSTGTIGCKFFRHPFKGFFHQFHSGDKVQVVGKVIENRGKLEFFHPAIHHLKTDVTQTQEDALVPIYPETERLSSAKIRKIISTALQELFVDSFLEETLPQWVCREHQLMDWGSAIRNIHQPPHDQGDQFIQFQSPAQKRMIFEEFFWFELALAYRKRKAQKEEVIKVIRPPSLGKKNLRQRFIEQIEFSLTDGQLKAYEEIAQDLERPFPMHRLLQGDVGCGKTIVALLASLHVIEAGLQVSMMVPTEILAEQHYQNFNQRLKPLGLEVALLTGHCKGKDKEKILQELRHGKINLVVGTHALLEPDVEFAQLGLAVVDEQHRFGVGQRTSLKGKGLAPHFLLMTATPIPRSLAMTVYGDLDISLMTDRPSLRKPVITRVVEEGQRSAVFQFLEQQVNNGRQAYIVYPLIEENERGNLRNATQEFDELKKKFPYFCVGLLHGKMNTFEKSQMMTDFRQGRIQILVSTTVIEVGVDVPNANFIIVEHAERFGLSQLHQLRGRVGRGSHKSYCVFLLAANVSTEAKKRVDLMSTLQDGFRLAEADLALRGPGEFLGTRQSGVLHFKLADLVRDRELLESARLAAFKLLSIDENLERQEHRQIQSRLRARSFHYPVG